MSSWFLVLAVRCCSCKNGTGLVSPCGAARRLQSTGFIRPWTGINLAANGG